jgi:Flp pilus assembly pilin Flp
MRKTLRFGDSGQGVIEYVLILVLLAVVILVSLAVTGNLTAKKYADTAAALDVSTIITPAGKSNATILADFKTRIMNFYNAKKKWPRTFSPYNYSDIGLNPDDWKDPVNGLYWAPHGEEIGLANKKGDNIEVYVKNLKGELLHLENGWNIWCKAANNTCYFHEVDQGNEVDISTIIITRK